MWDSYGYPFDTCMHGSPSPAACRYAAPRRIAFDWFHTETCLPEVAPRSTHRSTHRHTACRGNGVKKLTQPRVSKVHFYCIYEASMFLDQPEMSDRLQGFSRESGMHSEDPDVQLRQSSYKYSFSTNVI